MKSENLFEPNCIRTYSGHYIDVLNPDPDKICIEDIAHALSMQCRFGGHTKVFYSVAQHSLECYKRVSAEHRLAALLHDASEAYLMDIPSPIKQRLTNYSEIESKLMRVIAIKFGFQWPLHEEIKRMDALLLHMEWYNLLIELNPFDLLAYSQEQSKKYFIETFNSFTIKS